MKHRIAQYIRELADPKLEVFAIPGTVVKVYDDRCDVEPLSGDGTLYNVQLTGGEDSDVLIEPELNSTVLVVMMNNAEGFLAAWSKVKSITFHGGKLGGLPISDKVAKKISALESRVDALEQHAATHTHLITAPGSPSATALPVVVPKVTVPTKGSDLENKKIKQ